MFHGLPGVVNRKRSWCPTMAVPSPLFVQLPQVRSSPGGKAVPSSRDPVKTSCMLGESPDAPEFTRSPRSLSAYSYRMLALL